MNAAEFRHPPPETDGQSRKTRAATVLHVLATWLYIVFVALLIVLVFELWKGGVLDQYIHDFWFSYGGARWILAFAIAAVIAGRLLDVLAKRLNPRLRRRARGWPYYGL